MCRWADSGAAGATVESGVLCGIRKARFSRSRTLLPNHHATLESCILSARPSRPSKVTCTTLISYADVHCTVAAQVSPMVSNLRAQGAHGSRASSFTRLLETVPRAGSDSHRVCHSDRPSERFTGRCTVCVCALLVQLLGGRIARYHCPACTSGLGQSVWYPDQVLCLWRASTLPLRVCGVLRSIGMFAPCATRFRQCWNYVAESGAG